MYVCMSLFPLLMAIAYAFLSGKISEDWYIVRMFYMHTDANVTSLVMSFPFLKYEGW
jgi:hypothetical protein